MPEQMEMILKNSLEKIIEYSFLSKEEKDFVYVNIKQYLELKDKNSSSDDARKIRKNATDAFCKLYKGVFYASLEKEASVPVLLFLFFGYVSETVFDGEDIVVLCSLLKEIGTAPCVFTFYEWLKGIYSGSIDPSINTFSLDYAAYLRDKVKSCEITKEEAKTLLQDYDKRVEFELDNVFTASMKMMSSSVLTFCPVLTKDHFLKPVGISFSGKSRIDEAMKAIKEVDYSLFYRDYLYSNHEIGIDKAYIKKEILPNVVLMPCSGIRGVMWQEIEGADRQTPARFFMPIFMVGDLFSSVVNICGTYRWEMCKRIEGARWMDVSTHSLTSDYYDYVTNYKHNSDLSKDSKEKLKSQIEKSGKNPKGVFLLDYSSYIQNESDGSIRLNKVARSLLFEYCPFSVSVLEGRIGKNALYTSVIDRHHLKRGSEQHLLSLILVKAKKFSPDVPSDLLEYDKFLHM